MPHQHIKNLGIKTFNEFRQLSGQVKTGLDSLGQMSKEQFASMSNLIKPKVIEVKNESKPGRITNAELSAYTADVAETDSRPRETAMGTQVKEGVTIATNDESLMGKKLKYNNHIYTIEDKLGPRFRESFKKTGKLMFDIFIEDKKKALQFGRKKDQLIEIID